MNTFAAAEHVQPWSTTGPGQPLGRAASRSSSTGLRAGPTSAPEPAGQPPTGTETSRRSPLHFPPQERDPCRSARTCHAGHGLGGTSGRADGDRRGSQPACRPDPTRLGRQPTDAHQFPPSAVITRPTGDCARGSECRRVPAATTQERAAWKMPKLPVIHRAVSLTLAIRHPSRVRSKRFV